MKNSNKSLLIHTDSTTNKTTSIIIDDTNVVKETKAFLKKIAKLYKNATVGIYRPLGVVFKVEDKQYTAVVYEKEKFVIVAPNGTHASAKLYGNWNEALAFTQKLLSRKNNQKANRIVLAPYIQES